MEEGQVPEAGDRSVVDRMRISDRASPDTPSSFRIAARGWRAAPLVLRTVCVALGTLGVYLNLSLNATLGGGETEFLIGLLSPILVVAGADLALEDYYANRWIEIREDGILAVYRFHRTWASWSCLTPAKDSLPNQAGFVFDRGKGRRTLLYLTFEQMRAVLSSPHAPKWSLNPKVAKKLGLN